MGEILQTNHRNPESWLRIQDSSLRIQDSSLRIQDSSSLATGILARDPCGQAPEAVWAWRMGWRVGCLTLIAGSTSLSTCRARLALQISLRRVLTLTLNSGVHWGPRFHGNQQFFKKPLENMSPRLSRGFRVFQKTENGAKSLKI